MTSTTAQVMVGDGIGLMVRHWTCSEPKADVLILHGLGEHSGRYEHVGDFLVDAGYEVTSFDLRGHGASGGDRVDIGAFAEFLDDVELMVAETRTDRPLIVYGHSMGGLIAASYGMSNRPQPDYYVLSAPALTATVPGYLKVAAKIMGRVRPSLRMENSIKGEQLSKDPAVGEKYFADPLVETKATARFGSVFLDQMNSLRGQYDRLARPTLVIHGAEDELVPPHASAPLAALPNVKRKVFAGLRHETHNEVERDEVLGYVAAWLDSQFA